MKIPLRWLADYVETTLTAPQLAERLTLAGLEVAGLRYLGLPVPPGVFVKEEDRLIHAAGCRKRSYHLSPCFTAARSSSKRVARCSGESPAWTYRWSMATWRRWRPWSSRA